MFEAASSDTQRVGLTLYTDSHVVRGSIATRQRRLTDILNQPEHEFLVIQDAVMDEFGSRDQPLRADHAQINLGAVLFAVSDSPVQALPELRTPKVAEYALISIPPFRVTGRIHLLAGRPLDDALDELFGRFLPVTDATFWSDRVGEARTQAAMVAINHSRAQILAPHHEVDPWAGLNRAGGAEAGVSDDETGPATD